MKSKKLVQQSFKITLLISLSVLSIVLISCSKDDLTIQYLDEVVGNFEGYVTYDNGNTIDSFVASAEITKKGDSQILFHCQTSLFDTTLVMDLFENGDRLEMCLTGDDFFNMYGHQVGERHMGHMTNNQNSWSHHMDDEHEDGDQHFGGFYHKNGHMDYTFLIGVQKDEYTFYGSKK